MYDVFKNLFLLYGCITRKRKFFLLLIFIFTIFCSLLEVLSLSSIIPLLNFFTNPDAILENKIIKTLSIIPFIQIDNFSSIAKIFIFLVIMSTICRVWLIWISNYLSQTIYVDLATKLYSNTLNQSYIDFKSTDTNEAVSNILIKSSTIQSSIAAVINILISLVMIFFIIITLFYVQPDLTFYAFLAITLFYLVISRYTTKKFLFNGKVIASEIPKQHTIISGSLRSFKDMILDNIQGLFVSNFVSSIKKIRKITVSNIFLSQAPRYLLEGFVMCIIAGYLLILYKNGQSHFSSISTIAFIAAAGQRLLPIINAFYSNFQSLNSNNQSLEDILKTLVNENRSSKFNEGLNKSVNSFPFNESIEFKNVSFKYNNKKKLVLKNVSFTINKGDKVALIGPSGFGKTTLVDLLMGLLKPSSGEIFVDGINIKENINGWKKNISCISQDPFFFNTSIKNNIKLFNKGVNKRNYLNKLIEFFELKKIIKISNVGDNGSLISGGQKQRIALARTYFKNKNIVILDEATNALDIRLEKKILQKIITSIDEHTLIMIAHRKESISLCNKIIDLSKINKIK